MNEIKPNAVYNTEQVALLLNLSVITVQKYIRTRKIKAKRAGKAYKVLGEWVLEYIKTLPNA